MRQTLLILALIVAVAAPARAQALKLSFNDGRVSLEANAVPVRAILDEWAKLGSTKVVGADRITGAPLTVTLVDVPEAQALDIILRSVAGYMAAPRATVTGASIYDRILVMATSAAPSNAGARPTATRPGPIPGTQRFVPSNRRPTPQEDQQEADTLDDQEEEDPNPPNPPVFEFPQGGIFNGRQGPGTPIIRLNPVTGAPESITIDPGDPESIPADEPTTPFGTTGSSMPGVIQQPVPPPGQPRQPGPMVRPPG